MTVARLLVAAVSLLHCCSTLTQAAVAAQPVTTLQVKEYRIGLLPSEQAVVTVALMSMQWSEVQLSLKLNQSVSYVLDRIPNGAMTWHVPPDMMADLRNASALLQGVNEDGSGFPTASALMAGTATLSCRFNGQTVTIPSAASWLPTNKPSDQCAPGCPWASIGDGYCDAACRTAASCQNDASDCLGCAVGESGYCSTTAKTAEMCASKPTRLDQPAIDNECGVLRSGSAVEALASFCDVDRRCRSNWIGNGRCDPECNTAKCRLDGGDCAAGAGGPAVPLNTPWQSSACATSCPHTWVGDGYCDQDCRTLGCGWDRADCTKCLDGYVGLNDTCLSPTKSIISANVIATCAPSCYAPMRGDGKCDVACNMIDCKFDSGDCIGCLVITPHCSAAYCNEDCAVAQLRDGICDQGCNTNSTCRQDGGDCLGCKGSDDSWTCMARRLQPGVNIMPRSLVEHSQAAVSWCSTSCPPTAIADLFCDAKCNNGACGADGGDCTGCPANFEGDSFDCASTYATRIGGNKASSNCVSGCPWTHVGNGICDSSCRQTQCFNDLGDCSRHDTVSKRCAPGCIPSRLGDGICDPACDNAACKRDNGDCSALPQACAPGCHAALLTDNICDAPCNNAACGFDGGVCRRPKNPTADFQTPSWLQNAVNAGQCWWIPTLGTCLPRNLVLLPQLSSDPAADFLAVLTGSIGRTMSASQAVAQDRLQRWLNVENRVTSATGVTAAVILGVQYINERGVLVALKRHSSFASPTSSVGAVDAKAASLQLQQSSCRITFASAGSPLLFIKDKAVAHPTCTNQTCVDNSITTLPQVSLNKPNVPPVPVQLCSAGGLNSRLGWLAQALSGIRASDSIRNLTTWTQAAAAIGEQDVWNTCADRVLYNMTSAAATILSAVPFTPLCDADPTDYRGVLDPCCNHRDDIGTSCPIRTVVVQWPSIPSMHFPQVQARCAPRWGTAVTLLRRLSIVQLQESQAAIGRDLCADQFGEPARRKDANWTLTAEAECWQLASTPSRCVHHSDCVSSFCHPTLHTCVVMPSNVALQAVTCTLQRLETQMVRQVAVALGLSIDAAIPQVASAAVKSLTTGGCVGRADAQYRPVDEGSRITMQCSGQPNFPNKFALVRAPCKYRTVSTVPNLADQQAACLAASRCTWAECSLWGLPESDAGKCRDRCLRRLRQPDAGGQIGRCVACDSSAGGTCSPVTDPAVCLIPDATALDCQDQGGEWSIVRQRCELPQITTEAACLLQQLCPISRLLHNADLSLKQCLPFCAATNSTNCLTDRYHGVAKNGQAILRYKDPATGACHLHARGQAGWKNCVQSLQGLWFSGRAWYRGAFSTAETCRQGMCSLSMQPTWGSAQCTGNATCSAGCPTCVSRLQRTICRSPSINVPASCTRSGLYWVAEHRMCVLFGASKATCLAYGASHPGESWVFQSCETDVALGQCGTKCTSPASCSSYLIQQYLQCTIDYGAPCSGRSGQCGGTCHDAWLTHTMLGNPAVCLLPLTPVELSAAVCAPGTRKTLLGCVDESVLVEGDCKSPFVWTPRAQDGASCVNELIGCILPDGRLKHVTATTCAAVDGTVTPGVMWEPGTMGRGRLLTLRWVGGLPDFTPVNSWTTVFNRAAWRTMLRQAAIVLARDAAAGLAACRYAPRLMLTTVLNSLCNTTIPATLAGLPTPLPTDVWASNLVSRWTMNSVWCTTSSLCSVASGLASADLRGSSLSTMRLTLDMFEPLLLQANAQGYVLQDAGFNSAKLQSQTPAGVTPQPDGTRFRLRTETRIMLLSSTWIPRLTTASGSSVSRTVRPDTIRVCTALDLDVSSYDVPVVPCAMLVPQAAWTDGIPASGWAPSVQTWCSSRLNATIYRHHRLAACARLQRSAVFREMKSAGFQVDQNSEIGVALGRQDLVPVVDIIAPIPQDCVVGEWTDWSGCSRLCSEGIDARSRPVTVPQLYGGRGCPSLTETRPCYLATCRFPELVPTPFVRLNIVIHGRFERDMTIALQDEYRRAFANHKGLDFRQMIIENQYEVVLESIYSDQRGISMTLRYPVESVSDGNDWAQVFSTVSYLDEVQQYLHDADLLTLIRIKAVNVVEPNMSSLPVSWRLQVSFVCACVGLVLTFLSLVWCINIRPTDTMVVPVGYRRPRRHQE